MSVSAAKKTEKPQVEPISISEIARRLKLNRATVSGRLNDLGYQPDPSSTAKNQLYLFDSEMEFALKSAKDTGSATKIRQMRAMAQLAEMKLARERGELVEIAEAVEMVQKIVVTLYQEFKIRQPKRIGQKLARAKNQIEVKKILSADTERIMKGLRENFERYL
ncbi:MAG: hypothetical protein ABI539_01195 [Acidobacteriota bacterium]